MHADANFPGTRNDLVATMLKRVGAMSEPCGNVSEPSGNVSEPCGTMTEQCGTVCPVGHYAFQGFQVFRHRSETALDSQNQSSVLGDNVKTCVSFTSSIGINAPYSNTGGVLN